ncbi:hypothetical protein K9N68_20280 [Kovacikia minuta CCNUW1]|uniref:hypothetical protein n=1 Tax=Kovacikia minuta TaxID=2931930 RepID=UPI001CCA765E|nr:hypothetical protein [Kovacikia minuta]UBF24056.1 hypothetical protein K9N68_20280 [Kovacikia minuta CCNUW1]
MQEADLTGLAWAGLATFALYGWGLGLAVAALVGFTSLVITRFSKHRNNNQAYAAFVLAISGATIGLLVILPVAATVVYFTDVFQKCGYFECNMLSGLVIQTVRAAPSVGGIVAVIGCLRS